MWSDADFSIYQNFVIVYFAEGYDHPSMDKPYEVIGDIETNKPDSAILMVGDFNDITLRLHRYHQYVDV